MDPNHLPTQSSSYVGLLNSQQGSVFNENFHYESYHASVNFPESESMPPFSSQQPQQAPVKTPVARDSAAERELRSGESDTDVLKRAAKAKRNAPKGKSVVADYASVWEMKKEDLDRQERLSKFAIVDTLLAKTQPLTEAEEIPSESEDLFGNNNDNDYSETEDLIRRDQAELSLERRSQVQYPPQLEVEFGFPQVCYCGATPQLRNSRIENGKTWVC
ncbi:hypothetical protein Bca4012_084506 [Brassica carinata]